MKNFQGRFEGKDDYSVNYGYREDDYGKFMFNEPLEENIELGYVISVHKAQGSEFNKVYLILPKKSSSLLSMELLYTAVTRAQKHLTIFVQDDVSTFIELTGQMQKSAPADRNEKKFLKMLQRTTVNKKIQRWTVSS